MGLKEMIKENEEGKIMAKKLTVKSKKTEHPITTILNKIEKTILETDQVIAVGATTTIIPTQETQIDEPMLVSNNFVENAPATGAKSALFDACLTGRSSVNSKDGYTGPNGPLDFECKKKVYNSKGIQWEDLYNGPKASIPQEDIIAVSGSRLNETYFTTSSGTARVVSPERSQMLEDLNFINDSLQWKPQDGLVWSNNNACGEITLERTPPAEIIIDDAPLDSNRGLDESIPLKRGLSYQEFVKAVKYIPPSKEKEIKSRSQLKQIKKSWIFRGVELKGRHYLEVGEEFFSPLNKKKYVLANVEGISNFISIPVEE